MATTIAESVATVAVWPHLHVTTVVALPLAALFVAASAVGPCISQANFTQNHNPKPFRTLYF